MLFMLAGLNAFAQIPNNGFENWTTVGSYENPSGVWVTTNSYSTTTFYPVTKSTDHYPTAVGSYSIRLENKTSLMPSLGGYGLIMTNSAFGPNKPVFPVTGNPTSFCGYYKFIPQNGDTMRIAMALYKNGALVSQAVLVQAIAASNWTSFNLPFATYTSADSGFIHISSYEGSAPPAQPHGNSVLFVDNLSFNNLITGVSEVNTQHTSFSFYPNPANTDITINIDGYITTAKTLSIYNVVGELVKSEIITQNQQIINTANLVNGIYLLEIKSGNYSEKQKLIIQR